VGSASAPVVSGSAPAEVGVIEWKRRSNWGWPPMTIVGGDGDAPGCLQGRRRAAWSQGCTRRRKRREEDDVIS